MVDHCAVDLDLEVVVSSDFSTISYCFYPFSILCSLEGSPCVQPTLKSEGFLPLLEGSVYLKYLESHMADFSLLPTVFTHSLMSVWTNGSLFCT